MKPTNLSISNLMARNNNEIQHYRYAAMKLLAIARKLEIKNEQLSKQLTPKVKRARVKTSNAK